MAKEIGVTSEKSTQARAAREAAHPFLFLQEEMNRMFDHFGHGFFTTPMRLRWPAFGIEPFGDVEPSRDVEHFGDVGAIAPSVDVSESDEAVTIEVELPGMDEKDIDVTLHDGILTLKGEKKEQREEKKQDYYLSERRYGMLQRSFRLPDSVDGAKIKAEFKKGVLRISCPKRADAKATKKISIST